MGPRMEFDLAVCCFFGYSGTIAAREITAVQ